MAMLGNLSPLFGGLFGRTPTAPAPAPRPLVATLGHMISGRPAQPAPGGMGSAPMAGLLNKVPGQIQMSDAGGMRSPLPMGSMLGPANLPTQAKAFGARRRFA